MTRPLAGRSAASLVVPLALVSAACASAPPPAPAAPTEGASTSSSLAPAAVADVEIHDATGATVRGSAVPMDGVAEGLAWPALRAAIGRKSADHTPLTLAVSREVPTSMVLRAVWTLRDADLRLQTSDRAGAMHVLELRPKSDAPSTEGCHLAVFVAASGDLRVAAPSGPRTLTGPDAATDLARALASERGRCAIRYVAFGAESPDAAWGSVFDVAETVDRDKSAGDARYVLGEPLHAAAR